MRYTIAILIALSVCGASAQQRANDSSGKGPPVRLQRTPPSRTVAPEGVPAPDKYPFNQLINTLETDSPAASPTASSPAPGLAPGSPVSEVPKDFRPLKDVPLPA